tara:strand:- start:22 stop:600 length:579 start_codon:yes stop_codon:yes gene_type:complete
MKDKIVINIGYSNTGTNSLNEALTLLGYSSIHDAWDIYKEDNPIDLQDRLIPFYDNLSNDRNIFYGFISRYNAFTAAPTTDSSILESIIEQYPKAHYICTKRNHRERYKSVSKRTKLQNGRRIRYYDWIIEQKEADVYIDNVLKKNLDLKVLEFNICDGGHGWKELCTFLNEEIPKVNFPHLNKNIHRKDNK